MSIDPQTFTVIAVMTAAAAICRYAGFWFMRLLPLTPRVSSALDAIPLAVMLGIIVPPALRGGVPEVAGIAVAALAVHLRGNDLLAIISAMATVAGARALGF